MSINAAFDGGKLPMPPVDQPVAVLTFYEDACRAVAQAKKVDEVSQLRDVAEGMRAYARQAKNKQLEIEASEIRFRAERRLGQLMSAQKATVGLPKGGGDQKSDHRGKQNPGDIPTLAEAGIDKNLAKLARKYAAVPDEKFERILAERRETIEAANAKVTVDLLGPKGANELLRQSKTNEHYTPRPYLDAAREVLGVIDLDPASCAEANNVVQAAQFFTIEDDGLKRMWVGKVWLNPPYGGLAGDFVAKFLEEFAAKRVTSGILLLNAGCTDTSWFQPLFDGVLCFTDHRINFYGNGYGERGSPTIGSAFVYFGDNSALFANVFSQFGAVVRRYNPSWQ